MSEPELPPPVNDPVYGDMFGALQQRLSKRLEDAARRTDALLQAAVAGDEGPVDLSPEDAARFLQHSEIVLSELRHIAGALDMTRDRLTRLENEVRQSDEG